MRSAARHDLTVRGVPYHMRTWGDRASPCLVLLHGAKDFGGSFQFVVDALQDDWYVLAPDWRGHGRSGWTPGSYWQAEFVADLDVLLDMVVPGRDVVLAGHSMAANVASLFAAMAPARVRHLVMLDAMGELLNRMQIDVHDLLARAMKAKVASPSRRYAATMDLQASLMRHNPRLLPARAAFLAAEWLVPGNPGLVRGGDPGFKRIMPSLHRTQEWLDLWPRITAPVLYLASTDQRANSPVTVPDELRRRMAAFADIRRAIAPDTGHNVHHDAAELVARLIERHARGELSPDPRPA